MRNEIRFGVVGVAALFLAVGCTPPSLGGDGGEGGGAGGGGGKFVTDGGPADHDVILVRFNADGILDQGFGTAGVSRTDLTPGEGTTRDNAWSVTRDSSDRLIVFGSAKAVDRTDTDRVVMRFTPEGALDPTFGQQGKRWLDVQGKNDNPRQGFVQSDGKIVASGYTSLPTEVGNQSANSIVLQRLDADGNPDPTFGQSGVVVSNPFKPADPVSTPWGMAEAYAVAFQNGKYVTVGYGRAAATGAVDAVSFRYGADGSLDSTWAMGGTFALDLIGADERGRNLVAHPDGRVFLVGSGTPTTGQVDALVTQLSTNGALEPAFNTTGYKLFDFGRADEGLFGVALSPTGSTLAAVGHRAGGGEDDDAVLVLMPVATGAPAEVAKAVPLSETANDRLVSVAFDSAGRIVAAGYILDGTDSRVVVARFNPDGSFDGTFGQGGIASLNVSEARADEVARGVVLQSNGKIVLAGVAEHLILD